jgi:AcrR family transcriptional regulator
MHSTKEKIVNAARQLFQEEGYDATSIASILKKIGMSKGGLYHHFKSKEEIADAIIMCHIKKTKDYFESKLNEGMTPLEKLLLLLFAERNVLESKEAEFSIMAIYFNPKAQILRDKARKVSREFFLTPLVEILKEGKGSGDFTLRSPEVCSELILSFESILVSLDKDILSNPDKLQIYVDEVYFLIAQLVGIDPCIFKEQNQ